MTSQADDAALSDEPPMHHIISGEEEIARLACRFEEQQNQIVCENEVNTKPILAENEQLKEENAALNSSGQETVYNEFTRVENELELVKDELIQKEGSKIQRIPELEEEKENFIKYLEKVKQMYEEQNNHLTEIQEEKSKLDEHITKQKERILALEEERDAFHSQVEQLQTTTAKQDERLKSLMNDNYKLEANMSAQLMQIQSSDEEIQNLRTELESVHKTVQIQADEISQLNNDNSLLVEKYLNQELKLEEMIELEEERKTLLINLEDLRIKYEEQSEKMSIFRKKSITLDELVATQELNSSEKEKEALSKELEKIETTNKKLNDSLRELTKDKEETERIVSIETSVDQQIHMIEEEKQKLHSEQDMTQEKNVELNNKIKGIKQEKDALEKRVFNQRQQLDSFEKERQKMRAQLQTIKSTSEDQRNQLQILMKEKYNLHESFDSKMLAFEKEQNRLQNELEQLNKKKDLQEEELRASADEKYTLENIIATLRQELISSEKEKEALGKELEKIETTNKKLNDRLRELTNDKQELERKVSIETSVDQQVIVIEEENRKLQSEQDMTRQMNKELNIEIEGIRQEKDALEKQVFDQRQQLDSFEKERKQMRAQLQTIESTSEEQRNQLQELMKEKHNQHESFETKEQQIKEKDLHYTETYAHENEQLRNELSSVLKDEARLSTYLDPRAIAELYKNLYINVWSRTFETAKNLTFAGNVKNAVIKIIECVEMVNTFCKTECGEIKRHFKEMLEGETADLKADVFDEARIIQMITSGTSELALGLLVQVFMKTLNPGFQLQKLAYASPVFVRECIRIFWLLNVQWPQIETHTIKGGDFNRNVYEAFTEEGNKVEYVVWPALIYDETVLAKGVAKCYQSAILTQATSLPPIDVYQETSDKEEGCSSDEDGLEGNMPRYEVLNAALAGLSFTSGVQYNVYTEEEPNDTNGGQNGCSMLPAVDNFFTTT
ncbi:golgin subfamily A member 6-like protein 22 isoform X2 [Dreissena polymorpha]|uniref:golgin subfamily A member 6-like protein 22 isoform X2 n=1 Tax=Dreissena polymorpha TaxID=45954 RepID=UPI002264650F|nr:golgin subfamily A member 6-like protein 22 isoform X2 [Dreissena polymorpha]